MGMIFFEKSPRHVELEQARNLSSYAGRRIEKVAVTVDADDAYLEQILDVAAPDLLQLHGSESPDRVLMLKERFDLPIIKSISVSSEKDLDNAKSYVGIADHILFDAKAPEGVEIPGGNGVAFEWEIMDLWPKNVPYILSGGLNRENIVQAIERSEAHGIDDSSGVEISPGTKDIKLIRDFLSAVLNEEECVE